MFHATFATVGVSRVFCVWDPWGLGGGNRGGVEPILASRDEHMVSGGSAGRNGCLHREATSQIHGQVIAARQCVCVCVCACVHVGKRVPPNLWSTCLKNTSSL